MNAITKHEAAALPALQMNEGELIEVLATSLYPGAQVTSIKMVLGYCKAAGLDPMQKPVHIVPMWDNKAGTMRDVVMPGIGLYRTQAARSGECAGVSEPEFGPDVTEMIGGQQITFPAWCRVTVKRRLPTGEVVDFTAKEFWKENYAVKGGKDRSIAPNAMWTKRPYGQIAKCAEAQALRKAFPEIGSEPTADEMAGKSLHEDDTVIDASTGEITGRKPAVAMPARKPAPAQEHTVSDAQPKAEASVQQQAQQTNGAPATVGEVAYILKKINAKGVTIPQAREMAGLPEGENLEGLTKDGFVALKDALA